MEYMRLGRTDLQVARVGFGALPIQRVGLDEAKRILLRACEAGVNFYDTARMYSDSEEKLGAAFAGMRQKVIIASKVKGDGQAMTEALETSLRTLRTDYMDILQVHNPATVPLPDDGTGRYEALAAARQAGKTRFLGVTAHSVDVAFAAASSGLYETVQFPFSLLSSGRDLELPGFCAAADVGFIAMKGLGGGVLRDIPAAFAFMRRHENVLPIWGIQRMEELEQFLALQAAPPAWDAAMEAGIAAEQAALGKTFCRACGYCLPCPEEIHIPVVARMILMLGRTPWQERVTPKEQAMMAKGRNCTGCGQCKANCPYDLDTPELVRINTEGYERFLREKGIV